MIHILILNGSHLYNGYFTCCIERCFVCTFVHVFVSLFSSFFSSNPSFKPFLLSHYLSILFFRLFYVLKTYGCLSVSCVRWYFCIKSFTCEFTLLKLKLQKVYTCKVKATLRHAIKNTHSRTHEHARMQLWTHTRVNLMSHTYGIKDTYV